MFVLSYDNDEVSYSPSHCPFCGDFYDNENEELDFNDDGEYDDDILEDPLDDEDDLRRH
jgi:hypothetical protein